MLTLLFALPQGGKTTAILRDILRRAEKGETGLIWLTPEPFSHECERLLAKEGGAGICLHAEVLTFTRLADRVLAASGGCGEFMDEGGRLLTMHLAVRQAADGLSFFRRAAGGPEFCKTLVAAASDCERYGISVSTLTEAARHAADPARQKLNELALLLSAYNDIAARSGLERRDKTELAARLLEEGDYARDKRVYADGYVTFTPQENRALRAIAARGRGLTVTFTGDNADPFYGVTARAAHKLARGLADTEVKVLRREPAPLPVTRRAVCRSAGEELQCAADEIAFWVAEKGLRFRDIAVLLPEAEEYGPLAETELERAGIPVFTDSTDAFAPRPLTRALAAAVNVTRYGWREEDVLTLLRSGLTRVPPRFADELENYMRVWKPGKELWESGQPWQMPPGGYGAPRDAEGERRLRAINMSRLLLREPLRELENQGEAAAREHCAKIAAYLAKTRADRSLRHISQRLRASGEMKAAEETRQLWAIFGKGLRQCAALLGEERLTLPELTDWLLLLAGAYSVGSIPPSLDRVTVGTPGRLRKTRLRALAICGCRAETMPPVAPQVTLFSQEERVALEAAGAEMPPDSRLRAERALLDLRSALALPREYLLLTAHREKDGRLRAAPMFYGEPGGGFTEYAPRETPERRYEHLSEPLDPQAVESLYTANIALSASKLTSLFSCRLAFFLRYGMKAAARPEKAFQSFDRGRFVHEVLQKTLMYLLAHPDEGEDGAARAAREAANEYARVTLQGFKGQGKRFERLFWEIAESASGTATDVYREMRRSRFRVRETEKPFSYPSPRTGRFSVCVNGVIDRVDVWRNESGELYARAADYKTGDAEVDYGGLYQGSQMQLALYLSALTGEGARLSGQAGEGAKPAAFMNVPASYRLPLSRRPLTESGADEERRKKLQRSGVALGTEDVARAMEDPAFGAPVYTGKLHTATGEQFALLDRHVGRRVAEAARALQSGDVSPTPVGRSSEDNACRYCDFAPWCGGPDAYEYLPKLDAADFWEKLEAEGGAPP
ncbi:MAG: PD-(D/E)XK nuclease family protein [Oscillospiraceae bacterium]|nr:PD-(D/E)XK nuclease family protein [Oscillospiraceae bacterium]